jgi:hypothetical protein
LSYGKFEEIKWLFKKYHEQTYDVILKYDGVKGGVRFWVKLWKERELKK